MDGTTPATLPIRDTNGYIKAASPATGVYDNNLANGTKLKNELDNYAPMVRTTDIQNVGGIKRFLNSFYYAQRVAGISAFELFRIPVIANTKMFMDLYSRFGSAILEVIVATNGTDTVNSITINKAVVSSTSIYAACIYTYIDSGNLIVCVGNAINANSYYSINFKGCENDDNGILINPDITYCGAVRSTTGVTNAVVFP